jgi:hypothetical protein
MECDKKAVLRADASQIYCKPCRMKKEQVHLRTRGARQRRSDSFATDGPWQDNNIKEMEG